MVGKLLEEKSFPRGAPEFKPVEPAPANNVPKANIKRKEKDLFSNKEQKVVKKKKDKKKDKKKSLFDVSSVASLTYSQLSEVGNWLSQLLQENNGTLHDHCKFIQLDWLVGNLE